MHDHFEFSKPFDRLRKHAEATLASRPADRAVRSALEQTDAVALVHELQVSRIELEMQNAQLFESRRALEESLDRYRELYQQAPVGYLSLTPSGTVIIGNSRCADLLRIPDERLPGTRLASFLDDDSKADFARFMVQVLAGDGPQQTDVRLKSPAEPPTFLSLQGVREADGTECRLVMIDVTAVRAAAHAEQIAQQAAFDRDRLQLVQSVLDGLPFQVCLADADGNVLVSNTTWAAQLRESECRLGDVPPAYGCRSPLCSAWATAMRPTPTDAERAIIAIEQLRTGLVKEFRMEFTADVARGPRRFRLRGNRLAGSNDERFILTQLDITAQYESEQAEARLSDQLHESQKLEALGVLAGGIAHDFNNVLGAILGNVSLARQAPGGGEALDASLGEIERAGRRAADMVQGILTFSRRQPLQLTTLPLGDVIREAARLVRVSIPAGVSIETVIAPDTPPIRGQATQLQQVLVNLCTNAWMAIAARPQKNGAITIMVDTCDVAVDTRLGDNGATGTLAAGTYARCTVRDTGIGMDTATLGHVFEPFFTTRDVGEGTGLGLSVVHGIIASLDGVITAESTPGVGSCFSFYLPAAPAAEEAVEQAVEMAASTMPVTSNRGALAYTPINGQPAADHEQTSVMLLDDEPSILSVMTRLLRGRGFQLTTFSDPEHAIAALQDPTRRFDVLVTDQNMPKHSGIDVARIAAATRPELPVVVVTGLFTEELRDLAAQAGVQELISKPDLATKFVPLLDSLHVANRPRGGTHGMAS